MGMEITDADPAAKHLVDGAGYFKTYRAYRKEGLFPSLRKRFYAEEDRIG
jgi:hypothetical protein